MPRKRRLSHRAALTDPDYGSRRSASRKRHLRRGATTAVLRSILRTAGYWSGTPTKPTVASRKDQFADYCSPGPDPKGSEIANLRSQRLD